MNREQITQYLKAIGSAPSPTHREGWVVAPCPLAAARHEKGTDAHPSFAVKVEAGDGFTSCFSCGWHGSQSALVLEIRRVIPKAMRAQMRLKDALQLCETSEDEGALSLGGPDLEETLLGSEGAQTFPEWYLTSFQPAAEVPQARAYLKQREGGPVPLGVANALDLRWDSFEKRVCFPVRDFDGYLCGLHGRATDPDTEPRYRVYKYKGLKRLDVWLGEHWVDPERPVVLVESVFDLARVYQVYRNVVTPLNATPNNDKIARIAGADLYLTLSDNDQAGKQFRERAEKIPDATVKHIEVPVFHKDPGATPVNTLATILADHVTLDDFILA
jgi:DNA primase